MYNGLTQVVISKLFFKNTRGTFSKKKCLLMTIQVHLFID